MRTCGLDRAPERARMEKHRMAERISRWLLDDDSIRITVVEGRALVADAATRHQLSPTGAAALGRAMLCSVAVATDEKTAVRYSVQLKSDGPLKGYTVDAQSDGSVRGFLENPAVAAPIDGVRLTLADTVGQGQMGIVRNPEQGNFSQSMSAATIGEIDRDFETYVAQSHQVVNRFMADVTFDAAHGIERAYAVWMQALPDADMDAARALMDSLTDGAVAICATVVAGQGLSGTDEARALLAELMPEKTARLMGEAETWLACPTPKERFARALLALGAEQLDEMIAEGEPVSTRCQFCAEDVVFTPDDLRLLRGADA